MTQVRVRNTRSVKTLVYNTRDKTEKLILNYNNIWQNLVNEKNCLKINIIEQAAEDADKSLSKFTLSSTQSSRNGAPIEV